MRPIIIAGQGTDVGKTVVSAIITTALEADYWKPVQSGTAEKESDPAWLAALLDNGKERVHAPSYCFKARLSPHHAARLEGVCIDPQKIVMPQTQRRLLIEMVGGVLVPLTPQLLSLHVFQQWPADWILVSRHYLGSINHTLLTLELLRQRGIPLTGLVFNGAPNPDCEAAILQHLQAAPPKFVGRLYPEPEINVKTIRRYADLWRSELQALFHS